MSDAFIGQIALFAFSRIPTGWAVCDGQLLSVMQNQALFSLIGTRYGGDGMSTFALPDFRERVPLGAKAVGIRGGERDVVLTVSQMPSHTHQLRVMSTDAVTGSPSSESYLALSDASVYRSPPASGLMSEWANVGQTGQGNPHTNLQPYTAITFCIALMGNYPSRN